MHHKKKLDFVRELSKKIEHDSMELLSNNYTKVSQYNNGIYYHPDYISPVSKIAHNLNSEILIVLQDWASIDFLNKQEHTPEAINSGINFSLPTNKRLPIFIEEYFNKKLDQTYIINLFPYIKFGDIRASIPSKDYLYALEKYIDPFIRNLKPKLIIAIGSITYNTFRKYKRLDQINVKESIIYPCYIDKSVIFGVPHIGGSGTAKAGGLVAVKEHWHSLADAYINIK